MEIEIRAFEGDAEELAAFITANWRIQYAKNGYAPVLSGDYFRWMMPSFAAGDPSSIIAAYDGGTLVGVMPSDPLSLTLKGRPAMTLAREYLTVDSERLRGGIGRKLRAGLSERCLEIGARFATGFVNSGQLVGKGREFWRSMANGAVVLKRPRQWIRILDGSAASSAMHDRFDSFATWLGGQIGAPASNQGAAGVRPYKPADLPACHRIFDGYMRSFDMAYEWNEERLGHHLGFPHLSSTLVSEDAGGAVTGFATCYVFDVIGRRKMRNAIIDMVAPHQQPFSQKCRLLASATAEARAKGAHLAIVLGPPVNSPQVLLATRFVPMPPYRLLLAVFEPEPLLNEVQRPFALYR